MGRETTAIRTGVPGGRARDPISPFRTAIIDLCFEHGFARLTVSDLCRRAGLSLAAFHSYHSDLEDCFFDVCRVELGRYRRDAAMARGGIREWRTRLRATAYALYGFLDEGERLRRFAFVEALAVGGRPALLLGAELEALHDLIDEGRSEPSAPRSLTRFTAESLGCGIFSQIHCASVRSGPMPPESDFVPALMYSAVLPYVGAAAASQELRIAPPARPRLLAAR